MWEFSGHFCSFPNIGSALKICPPPSLRSSGVARAQLMPGHSMGTLRLQVASYPGPTQLSAACSTEMQKQLGGGLGGAPSENFRIFELPRSILELL